MIAHFFDIESVLVNDSKVWIVDRYNVNSFIMKLNQSDFNLIRRGIYKPQDNKVNLGGTEYFQKAQLVVANAQSSGEIGWKSQETDKNRYWIPENALQPVFLPIRECMYKFHRLGLDVMFDKSDEGRTEILKSLESLLEVYKNRPASFIMELFFNAKADEIVNIFSKGLPDQKSKVVQILTTVSPANTTKWYKIQAN